MLEFPGPESTSRITELEWPQEVVCLLEVWTDCEDFVDQILYTDDTIFAERSFNDSIIGKSNALLVDLSISTLVDEFSYGLQVWVTIGDVWLDDGQHFCCCTSETDEDTAVDLEETKELENLSWFWSDLVDTVELVRACFGIARIKTYPLIRMTKTSLDSAGT